MTQTRSPVLFFLFFLFLFVGLCGFFFVVVGFGGSFDCNYAVMLLSPFSQRCLLFLPGRQIERQDKIRVSNSRSVWRYSIDVRGFRRRLRRHEVSPFFVLRATREPQRLDPSQR